MFVHPGTRREYPACLPCDEACQRIRITEQFVRRIDGGRVGLLRELQTHLAIHLPIVIDLHHPFQHAPCPIGYVRRVTPRSFSFSYTMPPSRST